MKNSRLIILLLLGGACCLNLVGKRPKSLSEGLRPASEKTRSEVSIAVPKPPRNLKVVQKDDTVYCIATTQGPGGWQMPLARLTKEQAEKMTFSVRLSNVNKKGHYGRLECLGYGLRPVPYNFQFGIFERMPDSLVNEAYTDVQCSRIDMLSDAEGENVTEIRYYDPENKPIIYEVLQQHPELPKVWLTHFYSPVGLPVEMLKNGIEPWTYYSEDRKSVEGFFVGPSGLVSDKNGEYGVRETFDFAEGYRDKTFLDHRREPMIGGSGYATERQYYGPEMDLDSIVYLDTEGNKMEVGFNLANPSLEGVAKRVMRYNERHQLTEELRLDKSGSPADKGAWPSRIVHKYDKWWNRTGVSGTKSDGTPALLYGEACSSWWATMDSLGNSLEYHQFGPNGQPANLPGYVSSLYAKYDPSGRETAYRYYEVVDGKEKLMSSKEHGKAEDVYKYSDGSRKTEKRDNKGRILSSIIVDTLGQLDSSVSNPKSEYIYEKDKAGNITTINNDYDYRGQLSAVYITDSLTHVVNFKRFDANGNLINHYGRQYDENWDAMKHYDMLNSFDQRVRRGDIEMPQFLRLTFDRTINGDYYNMRAVDEFGETDYMVYSDWDISIGKDMNTSGDRPFFNSDEDGKRIDDMREQKRKTPKYMSIEVLDSTAYRLGLKDNDLILGYGETYRPNTTVSENDFISDWVIASTFNADKPKEITVFRIESTAPEKCRILTLPLPEGTIRDLGFTAHLTYKTRRQQKRIDAAGGVPSGGREEWRDYEAVVSMPRMFLQDRDMPYVQAVGTPAMLVGAEVMEMPHIRWIHGDDLSKLGSILSLNDSPMGAPFHLRQRYFNGKECIDVLGNNSDTYLSLRNIGTNIDSTQNSRMSELAKDFTPGAAIEFEDSMRGLAGEQLYVNGFYDEVLPLLEAGAERGERLSTRYLMVYYKYRKNDPTKAAEYARHAAELYEAMDSMEISDKEELANLYSQYDPEKAGGYLGRCIREIEISEDSPLEDRFIAFRNMDKYFKSIMLYCDEGSEAYIDGAIYAGLKAGEIGLKDSIIVEDYLSKAAMYGRLKAEHADATQEYYYRLANCTEHGEQFPRMMKEFMADKVGVFRVIEEPGRKAYDMGMRGEYTIIRFGDWDILSDEYWHVANRRLRDQNKRVVLLSDKGEIIDMEVDGLLGASFELKSLKPKERAKILKLIERYKK
ncbi:MAG: hypothetical protein K2M06_08735 [Muribaculaceae bacterium]|nr:hypothetical protein [Muribaculaceae bacterium]